MTQEENPCERANTLLGEKLTEALDAMERGSSRDFDQALEDMVKVRKGMELGGCSLKKPVGFQPK